MELEELRRISAREELSLNFTAKDEMISKILLDLQKFNDIVIKGGTAINRVYLKNKRFSEGIDFDVIFKGTAKEALIRTKEIVAALRGFTVEKPRIMNETIRYDLFYMNPLNHQDKIRLEFRIIKKANNYSRKIVNFGFVPFESALLNVYNAEELIRNKIDCILNRIEGKDFFDLYYLMDLPDVHSSLLMEKKNEIIKRISMEEAQIKTVANVINHYIPKDRRPQWSLFLEDLKEKIKKYKA